MIWRAKDKPMGYTDTVFCWFPRVISIHRTDDEGYNLGRENYIFWFSYVQRTVVESVRTGLYTEYQYEYNPLEDV